MSSPFVWFHNNGKKPYVHLVRGALLADAGDAEAAARSLREAARCARNEHERAQIEKRISELPAPWGGQ